MGVRIVRELELRLPKLPNFIRYGDKEDEMIDVAELKPEQIRALADEWGTALIEHSAKRFINGRRPSEGSDIHEGKGNV